MSCPRDGSKKNRSSRKSGSSSYPRLNVLVDSDVKTGKNSYVVNVNPGQYQLSLDVKHSKRTPIRISLSPDKQIFPSPKRPVELLYTDNIPEPTLRRLQSGKTCRKRFRWASFCLGSRLMRNFRSDTGEDFAYDGLEHLSRTNNVIKDSCVGLFTLESYTQGTKGSKFFPSLKSFKNKLKSGLIKLWDLARLRPPSRTSSNIPVNDKTNSPSVRASIGYADVDTEEYDADSESSSSVDCDLSEGTEKYPLTLGPSVNQAQCSTVITPELGEDWTGLTFYNSQIYPLKSGISTDSMEINKILSEGLIITSSSPAKCDVVSHKREFHRQLSQASEGNAERRPPTTPKKTSNDDDTQSRYSSFNWANMTGVNSTNTLDSIQSTTELSSVVLESSECGSVSDDGDRTRHVFNEISPSVRTRRAQSEGIMGNGSSSADRQLPEVSIDYGTSGKSSRKRYLRGIRNAFSGPSLSRSRSSSDSFLSSPKKSSAKLHLPAKLNSKKSPLYSNLADITNRTNNDISCQQMTHWEQVPKVLSEDAPILGTNVVGRERNASPEKNQTQESDSHVYENTYFQSFREPSKSLSESDTDSTSSGSFTVENDVDCASDSQSYAFESYSLENSASEKSLPFLNKDTFQLSSAESISSDNSEGTRFYSTLIPEGLIYTNSSNISCVSDTHVPSEIYQDVSYYFTTSEAIVLDSDNENSLRDSDQESAYKSFYFSTAGDSTCTLDDSESTGSDDFQSVYPESPEPLYVNTQFEEPKKEPKQSIKYAYSSPLHGHSACGVESKPLRTIFDEVTGWPTKNSKTKSSISSSYASRQYHPEREPKDQDYAVTTSKNAPDATISRSSTTSSIETINEHDSCLSMSSSDVTSDILYSFDSEDTFPDVFTRDSPDFLLSRTPSLSSSGSSISARKPPVSPGSRDHSVPREGRSLVAPRRRCRSASNSGRLRPDSYVRPTSLFSPAKLSQESLDEVRSPRFSSYILDERAPDIEWLAEDKKNQGNELHKLKKYKEAAPFYTQAIELCPDCAAYYSNRSACYMMLGKYADALADAKEAVRLDAAFVKAYVRVGKCYIALGDGQSALAALKKGLEIESSRTIRDEITKAESLLSAKQDAQKHLDKKDYRTALFHIERALVHATGSRELNIMKAECCVYACKFTESNSITSVICRSEPTNAEAFYVRGLCLYHEEMVDQALNWFQHCLRMAPDHKKAKDAYKKCKLLKEKKSAGNAAFQKMDFASASKLYTEGLQVDPTVKIINAKLYCNRATVRFKLEDYDGALSDCNEALSRDGNYVKALLKRAQCYQKLEKHEEAVRDYENAQKLDSNKDYSHNISNAKRLLHISKRKDYYKILGVSRTASLDEIKRAFKLKAKAHHPDRHSGATDDEKKKHEAMFKEINESYDILSDDKKRRSYDAGQDINNQCGSENEYDIFQTFSFKDPGCCGGGSGFGTSFPFTRTHQFF